MDLMEELDRPIAFHRCFVRITGSLGAAVMLSQAIYWSNRTSEGTHGWFWKTQTEWEEETGLTRREQESARKSLRNLGLIAEKLTGIPARLWFLVDKERLSTLLRQQKTSMAETAMPVCTEPPNQYGVLSQTNTETTQRLLKEEPENAKFVPNEEELPIPEELWQDFVDHRKKKKCPMTPQAEKMQKKRLRKAHEEGYDVPACMEEAIAAGWQQPYFNEKSPRRPVEKKKYTIITWDEAHGRTGDDRLGI